MTEDTDLGDFWTDVVRQLAQSGAVKALPRQLALQSQLVARVASAWTLRVENQSLAGAAVCERLEAALADHGHRVRLKLVEGAVTDSPARRQAAARAQRLADAEALLMADPFVQKMMRDFDARVVPGSIQPL